MENQIVITQELLDYLSEHAGSLIPGSSFPVTTDSAGTKPTDPTQPPVGPGH